MSPPWSTSSARCRANNNALSEGEENHDKNKRRHCMIRVTKIAHASYETPDLAQQTEYYTDILGLAVAAKEKDAVYLASTVDHHSVVLRQGAQAQCMRVGFQIPPDA